MGPSNNEIIYIDDSRISTEKNNNKEKYYDVINVKNSWFDVDSEDKIKLNVLRTQQKKIDTKLIYNAKLIDNDDKEEIIEVYDPYKGIIPGIVDKELFYKTSFDPAVYNVGNSDLHNINENNYWVDSYVGKTWWDLRTVRYIDYEIDTLQYKREFWGKIAPETSIDVYEWVKSKYKPDEYYNISLSNEEFLELDFDIYSDKPSGIPYMMDQENGVTPYSEKEEINEITGEIEKYYYYWVKNKKTLPRNKDFRKISVYDISKILRDPTNFDTNYKWFSPISNDSVIIANIFYNNINEKFKLQINWLKGPDVFDYGNWHEQWILGREKDPNWIIDEILYKKMVDSLVGYDDVGNSVPDEKLNEFEKYGNLIRPRQSWFIDRYKARLDLINLLNKKFTNIDLTKKLNGFSDLFLYDKEPDQTEYDLEANDMNHLFDMMNNNTVNVGQKILVKKNIDMANFWSLWKVISDDEIQLVKAQLYDTTDFIKYSDYYSEDIDPNIMPSKIFKDIQERNNSLDLIKEDEIILVKDIGGFWEWQKYENNNFITVAKQNATINFSDKFFTNRVVYGINENWNNFNDYKELLSKIKNRDGSLELKILLNVFKNGYMENLLLNEIFFSLVRFSLSENKPVDWVMKSSYVLFGGFYETLSQSSILKPSLFDSIVDYLNEIKPYHVKFRDFYRRITTKDTYDFDVNDFDYPDENMRRMNIKQKFDRVTCDSSDEDPVSIIIKCNGISNHYDLIVDNNNIYTIPKISDYEVYKENKNVQPWDQNNIEHVYLKDLFNNSFKELSEKDWKINEIVYFDINTSTYKKKLVLVLSFVPKANDIIEIKRRLYASDRINYYYKIIDKLVNNKEVKHKIPEKNIKDLISYCNFRGTTVEGGSLKYTRKDFHITLYDANLYANWDIEPDKNFIQNNLISEKLPDGNSFSAFISAHGEFWLEEYYNLYSYYTNDPLIKYLNMFYENYSWDINSWDGVMGISSSDDSEEIEGITSAKNDLYDTIYESGTQLSGFPDYIDVSVTLSSWTSIDNIYSSATSLIVEGNKFIQPYMGPKHPEELTLLKNKDLIIMDNHLLDLPGGVKAINYMKIGNIENGDEFIFEDLPQSKESVLFFINGLLLDIDVDYEINWEQQKLIYKGPSLTSNNNQIYLRYYTNGGSRLKHREFTRAKNAKSGFYGYEISSDFDLINVLSAQNIFATIDGFIVSAIDVVDNEVLLDLSGVTVTANSLVIINVYDSFNIVKVRTKNYILSSGQTLLDINYVSNQLIPVDQNILVFSSGKRLFGPNHRYFFYNNDNIYNVGIDLSGISYNVYVNDEMIYDHALVSGNTTLVEITSSFPVDSFITIQINDNPIEYNILNSANSVTISFVSSKNYDLSIKVVTFENNYIQNLKTEKFSGNAEGKYKLSLLPYSIENIMVHIDGLVKIYSVDYKIDIDSKGYDEDTYGGESPYGIGDNYLVIDFDKDQTGQNIYVTYSVGKEMEKG